MYAVNIIDTSEEFNLCVLWNFSFFSVLFNEPINYKTHIKMASVKDEWMDKEHWWKNSNSEKPNY
jgi:hypothetical protein